MLKTFILSVLMTYTASPALAGYVPPSDSPYWCYQACIAADYSNHNECVRSCYKGGSSKKTNSDNCSTEKEKGSTDTWGGACCSWGENIQGCFKGC